MQAIISGIAGTALLVDGPSIFTLGVDAPTAIPSSQGQVRRFLAHATDAYAIEDVDFKEIRQHLASAWEASAIFDLVQILFGPDEEESTRTLAVGELEESLKDRFAAELAERRLFGALLPVECKTPTDNRFESVSAFVVRLLSVQDSIGRVESAFLVACQSLSPAFDVALQKKYLATAIREGFFRTLVLYAYGEESKGDVFFKLDRSLSLKSFVDYRSIATAWLKQINVAREHPRISEPDTEEFSYVERDAKKPRRRQSIDRTREHQRVLEVQAKIEKQMKQGRIEWAIENASKLVRSQLRKSGSSFACQTLSSLAKRAQDLGFYPLQLVWAQQAKELDSDDPVAAAQFAHALLTNNRLVDALHAYDIAVEQFPLEVAAKNGRAEVLQSMGRFEDALLAYDQVTDQHPEDVFAKCGRAEVLRSMGRLADALQAYDKVIEQHSENIFAKCGRAEVLRSMGRLADALQAYDKVIEQHSENVVAKCGRAEVLRSLGRFADALWAYDQVIEQHPENVFAKSGRAEVLRSLGRFADALWAYDQVIEQHPENVVAKSGRAEVLQSMGRFEDALQAYDQVIEQHPEDVFAKCGRAEVLRSMGRFEDALQAYDQVIEQHPESVVAKTGSISVFVAAGKLVDAAAMLTKHFGELTTPRVLDEWTAVHIRAMIYLKTGKLEEAERDLLHGIEHCSDHQHLEYFKNSLAIVQLMKGRTSKAREALRASIPATPPSMLIHGLVAFEEGDEVTAEKLVARVNEVQDPRVSMIRNEMRLKYVDHDAMAKPIEWLLGQLVDLQIAA